MLARFFCAPAGGEVSVDDHAHVEAKRVDPVKLSSLGRLLGVSPGKLVPLDPDAETQWTLPIDAAFVGKLATLDAAARATTAAAWAATPEWQADKGTAESLDALLAELAPLADRATRAAYTLYLWISL